MNIINVKSVIKYRLKRYFPKIIWLFVANLNNHRKNKKYSECRKNFGKLNEELHIYVIRRRPPGGGLFSNVNHVLQGLIYSEDNQMCPVVDMENYITEYSSIRGFNGKRNAWEYFFSPVSKIELREAYRSKNVTLSEGDRILKNHLMSGRNISYVTNKDFLEKVHLIYNKYIKLNQFTNSYIQYIYNFCGLDKNNTLGVFLRGRDYLQNPTGHPIQPKIKTVIKDISSYLEEKPINKIFLSTDDEEIRESLVVKFGDLVIRSIRSDAKTELAKHLRDKFKIPSGAIARNISYLSEIYILSELDYNIASLSNGSAIMHVLNGNKFRDNLLYYYGVN
jgi:hypothetical protein